MTDLEKEALLFAEDLFSDCMSLHPVFQIYLPEHSPTLTKSSNFAHAVSKSIMLILKRIKKDLTTKFRRDFNSFSKNDATLKLYLEPLCDLVRDVFPCKLGQVLGLSAVLLELIAFLYRRGYTYFLSNAPRYWLLMFKNVGCDEFYKSGGWAGLTELSKILEINYDDNVNAIYWMYWDSNLKPLAQPDKGNEKRSASKEASSDIVTDFASGSVITAKAGLDTHSEDKVGTYFEGGKPSNDLIIPKTLEPTKQFSQEMTPKEPKALDSKEERRKLDTHSEDKVGTDFEGGKPSNDPIIPKTLEPTKQFSQEMTPKEQKALDSKEQGIKLGLSKVENEPLEKKGSKYVSLSSKQPSEKDTVSDCESSLSRGSSAPMDTKYHTPNVEKQTSASYTENYKCTTPDKPQGKSGSMSTSASDKSSPSKTDSGSTRSTDTVPKGENTEDASIQSSPKAVTKELEKVDSSDRKNPDEQDASSIVSSDDFEGEKPSNDPIIPKTLEPTEQFSQEVTPKEQKALDSKEEGRKSDLSEVTDNYSYIPSYCMTS